MHYFKIMTSRITLCVFKVQRNDNSMLNTIKFYILIITCYYIIVLVTIRNFYMDILKTGTK